MSASNIETINKPFTGKYGFMMDNILTTITNKPFTGKYGFMMDNLQLSLSSVDLDTVPPAFLNAVEKVITSDTTYNTIIANLRLLKASHPEIKLDINTNTNAQEDIKNCLMKAPRQIAGYVSIGSNSTIFSQSTHDYSGDTHPGIDVCRVCFNANICQESNKLIANFTVQYYNDAFSRCVLFDCNMSLTM